MNCSCKDKHEDCIAGTSSPCERCMLETDGCAPVPPEHVVPGACQQDTSLAVDQQKVDEQEVVEESSVSLGAEPHGPDEASLTVGQDEASLTVGPDEASLTLRPDNASLTIGPDNASLTIGPDNANLTIGPDDASLTVGPDNDSLPVGPDNASFTVDEEQVEAESSISLVSRCERRPEDVRLTAFQRHIEGENAMSLELKPDRGRETLDMTQHLQHLMDDDGDIDPAHTSSRTPIVASSSSSCCRICQDTNATTETLSRCHCRCKGQLSRVHRSCLVEWVRYKGSNKCEICGELFRDVPHPTLGTLGVNQMEAIENMRRQLVQYQPITNRKRTTITGVIIILLIASGVMCILTISADSEFHKVSQDPESSNHELKKAHIVFSACMSLLFFCLTLTIGVSLTWFFLELYFYLHRRNVISRTSARLMADARQSAALWRAPIPNTPQHPVV